MTLTADSGGFQRQVDFHSGYNELHDKSGSSIGQHGMEIVFALTGDRGAVQFAMHTGWTPLGPVDDHLKDEAGLWPSNVYMHPTEESVRHMFPMPQALGYHWAKPFREDMTTNECDLILSGECYSDVRYTGTEHILRDFISLGEESVWANLENWYHEFCVHEDYYNSTDGEEIP